MPPAYSQDGSFMKQLNQQIDEHLHDEKFGVAQLADLMSMSRASLYRKAKLHSDKTINHLICEKRLIRSKDLLKDQNKTISEIAYEVGFSNVSYYIKCFHDYFGLSPGQVRKRKKGKNGIFYRPFKLSQPDRGFILVMLFFVIFISVILVHLLFF